MSLTIDTLVPWIAELERKIAKINEREPYNVQTQRIPILMEEIRALSVRVETGEIEIRKLQEEVESLRAIPDRVQQTHEGLGTLTAANLPARTDYVEQSLKDLKKLPALIDRIDLDLIHIRETRAPVSFLEKQFGDLKKMSVRIEEFNRLQSAFSDLSTSFKELAFKMEPLKEIVEKTHEETRTINRETQDKVQYMHQAQSAFPSIVLDELKRSALRIKQLENS